MAPLPELPFQEEADLDKEEYETLRKTVLGEENEPNKGPDPEPHRSTSTEEKMSPISYTLSEEEEPLPRGLQFMDDAWSLFKRGYRLFHSKR